MTIDPKYQDAFEPVPVLDKGEVQLLRVTQDYNGRTLDQMVVDSARISYLSESEDDRDRKLIRYMMKHRHSSPFEQPHFTFRVKTPLFVARQWMRHRTWSYNEVSRRYTSEEIDFYTPRRWRKQADTNRQASKSQYVSNDELENTVGEWINESYHESVFFADGNDMADIAQSIAGFSMSLYERMIDAGVAREQARILLPQSMYTTFIATVDAHNLMHFIELRDSEHAQWEMQQYARVLNDIFAQLMPVTAEAFQDRLDGKL